jgi:hypothetical protein
VSPSNERERLIAQEIDRIALEPDRPIDKFEVNFVLTAEDAKFVMAYIRWRMANPLNNHRPYGRI